MSPRHPAGGAADAAAAATVQRMRILVTGGSGFIGTAVVAALLEAGHDPFVLDLRPTAGAPAVRADVRDEEAVTAALRGVDAVVHLAAKVGVERSIADAPVYVTHNDGGTATVMTAMAATGVGRLVLAGSMVVYGEGLGRCPEHGAVRPAARRPDDLAAGRFEPPCPVCGRALLPELVGEDAPLDPRSVYAASKVAQEHLAGCWARQCDGALTTLRFHNVYGPGLPLGTPYAGVAALFRTEVLAGRPPQVTEDGGQRRDFVHVRDVARACVAAVVSDAVAPGTSRAFNVGSGVPRTVLQLATSLAAAAGAPAPVVTGAARLADVRHVTASSERAARELGWRAGEDLDATLPELLA